ncbi:THO complex subunit 6 homolog isoform X2 [Dreissena polymorpha]|uniref:THO complex subunit 6 homolog isoform X2 n=1 Tax=Dreissena polymorpha TaxID=45954 RepID=UPI0022656507|nr:THO complex subunit 6 homolog isoform X2 [Dreissena polymorpha]
MTGTADSERKLLHTTVFAQCFSPCGKYLAAANNFGKIAVFSLLSALAPTADDETRKPFYSFDGGTRGRPIYCLLSTETFLISAGNGDISAWTWAEVLDKAAKEAWTLKIPKLQMYSDPETNSIALSKQETGTELYGGCGDDNVHVWDIESGRLTRTLSGHRAYIHAVCTKNMGRECVSASEDGSVRIWDCRIKGEAVHILDNYVKINTCNATVYGELGRYPLYVNIYVRTVKYWLKMINSKNIIIQTVFIQALNDCNKGCNNWVANVKPLLNDYGFSYVFEAPNITNSHAFVCEFKCRIIDTFKQEWFGDMNRISILDMYRMLKTTL